MPTDPLSELRDIHLPVAINFWPLSLGWWLLVILVIIMFVAAAWSWRLYRAKAAKRLALATLSGLKNQFDINSNQVALLAEVSILLRRYALSQFPRQQVAGLIGDAWLSFLDNTGGDGAFRQGIGKVLVTAPYDHCSEKLDVEALIQLSRNWIKKVKP